MLSPPFYNIHAEENRGRNASVLLRCGAFIFVLSGFIRIDDESYIWSKSERINAKYGLE